jgi:NAD(P)-dependent dehydrogenase (short-subunit alcohol dehydrogenase family)
VAVTVVVGATGELGRPLVERLVGLGHAVCAAGRDQQTLRALADAHPQISTCAADVTTPAGAAAVLEHVRDAGTRMLVYLAAAPVGRNVMSVTPEDIATAIGVKVGGLLRLVQALAPTFTADSRVVAVGGLHGFQLDPDTCVSGLANAAQAVLIRQLSWELGRHGVTCHLVSPGPVESARFAQRCEVVARDKGLQAEDVMRRSRQASPLGRLPTPQEVAWTITQLAEPEAATLTGSVLFADGGMRREIR